MLEKVSCQYMYEYTYKVVDKCADDNLFERIAYFSIIISVKKILLHNFLNEPL